MSQQAHDSAAPPTVFHRHRHCPPQCLMLRRSLDSAQRSRPRHRGGARAVADWLAQGELLGAAAGAVPDLQSSPVRRGTVRRVKAPA